MEINNVETFANINDVDDVSNNDVEEELENTKFDKKESKKGIEYFIE